MFLQSKLFLIILLLLAGACGRTDKLRPTLATLKHPADKKFIGQEGVKDLLENHLGVRFLAQPEIRIEAIKNRSKSDLKIPNLYEKDEIKYADQLRNGYLADIYVKFISDEIGYGLFANGPIKKGDLIAEFTGIIQNESDTNDSTWAWAYPYTAYNDGLGLSPMNVDGKYAGNALRFVNHSDNPNTEMKRIFLDGFIRSLYVSTRDIAQDEQISVSYGTNYWQNRQKRDI